MEQTKVYDARRLACSNWSFSCRNTHMLNGTLIFQRVFCLVAEIGSYCRREASSFHIHRIVKERLRHLSYVKYDVLVGKETVCGSPIDTWYIAWCEIACESFNQSPNFAVIEAFGNRRYRRSLGCLWALAQSENDRAQVYGGLRGTGQLARQFSASEWSPARWTLLVYHLPADKSVRAECFAVPHRVRTVHKQRGFPGVRLSSHVPGVYYLSRLSRAVASSNSAPPVHAKTPLNIIEGRTSERVGVVLVCL